MKFATAIYEGRRFLCPSKLQASKSKSDIDHFVPYAGNPGTNDAAADRMCSSIREFGFKFPVLARSDGGVVDGHLRLKAAQKLGITEIPVILCDEWSEARPIDQTQKRRSNCF
jgi:hypothetical protein